MARASVVNGSPRRTRWTPGTRRIRRRITGSARLNAPRASSQYGGFIRGFPPAAARDPGNGSRLWSWARTAWRGRGRKWYITRLLFSGAVMQGGRTLNRLAGYVAAVGIACALLVPVAALAAPDPN